LPLPTLAVLVFASGFFKVKLNSLITGCEIPLEFMFFSKIAIENEDFKISGEIALTVIFPQYGQLYIIRFQAKLVNRLPRNIKFR